MSRQYSVYEIYEVLSADLQNIKHLPLRFAIEMFYHRLFKIEEKKAWDMYLTRYQNMDRKTYKPFKFDKPNQNISKKSTEEILSKSEEILKKLSKKGG